MPPLIAPPPLPPTHTPCNPHGFVYVYWEGTGGAAGARGGFELTLPQISTGVHIWCTHLPGDWQSSLHAAACHICPGQVPLHTSL